MDICVCSVTLLKNDKKKGAELITKIKVRFIFYHHLNQKVIDRI